MQKEKIIEKNELFNGESKYLNNKKIYKLPQEVSILKTIEIYNMSLSFFFTALGTGIIATQFYGLTTLLHYTGLIATELTLQNTISYVYDSKLACTILGTILSSFYFNYLYNDIRGKFVEYFIGPAIVQWPEQPDFSHKIKKLNDRNSDSIVNEI